jgi:hypothetical protein
MDGLSAAASVIAVLQLTGEVIGYLNDVKDAPKECQQCTIEASNIQNLLINLRYRLEQEAKELEVQAMETRKRCWEGSIPPR